MHGRNGIPAIVVLLALCVAAQLGCSDEPEPTGPPPKPASAVDPDVSVPGSPDLYRSDAVGLTISKPEGWVFLTVTSMPDPERWGDRLPHEELIRTLVMPYKTPLVAMATVPEPRTGVDPVVRVFARPFRGEGAMPVEFASTLAVAATNAQGRNARPDFAIEEGPDAAVVGGLPGASTVVRWSSEGADGLLLPLLERILYAPRGRVLFWIELERPLPQEGHEEAFARIVASLAIEPDEPAAEAETAAAP